MVLVGIYLASLFLAGRVACVVFSERGDDDYDQTFAVSSMAKSCLAGADPLLSCFNERAMAALERAETMETVRLDAGLELARRPGPEGVAPRGVYSFGENPFNVGAVVEAASSLLSRRTFCWDLSFLYPGLQMRVGPTYSGKGIIDFIVDSRRTFDERSLNYGHLLFKRSLLPNLLTTQISIISVIPFIFAAIYFLTKKAFLLSKFALIVTSVVGYGSLILQHSIKPHGQNIGSHFGQHIGQHFGQHVGQTFGQPFKGDIRGDKFHDSFNSFQQISSSKLGPLFRGVNYFPQEDQTTYDEIVE